MKCFYKLGLSFSEHSKILSVKANSVFLARVFFPSVLMCSFPKLGLNHCWPMIRPKDSVICSLNNHFSR